MTEKPALPDEMFLVSVEDEDNGASHKTFSVSRTPTVLMSYAANKLTAAASDYFRDAFGVGTVDWRMMFHLARHPGATAAASAKTIGIDKGTVSRCLHRLAKNGYAAAGDLHANGRSRGWRLTDEGRAMHDAILAAALERQRHLLKGFEAGEVEQLSGLLRRFLENLEALAAED